MTITPNTMLYAGPQWRGSNARALANAFRQLDWLVDEVDPRYHVPSTETLSARVIRRALTPIMAASYNTSLEKRANSLRPEVFFVFKGEHLSAHTLRSIRDAGALTALYYPDVSMFAHGRAIPSCLPHYDVIFTSKSFGLADIQSRFGDKKAYCVLHGFDPAVHRRLPKSTLPLALAADVSFIGTWSPKKERLLSRLVEAVPNISLRIWGSQWERVGSGLAKYTSRQPLFGDFYAAAIQSSRICLGLLSEVRLGASSGDLTTARTFEIPACGAFLLHERNSEVLTCFDEGTEVACFSSAAELIEKVNYYLSHNEERLTTAEAGYRRAHREHSRQHRAKVMMNHLTQLGIRNTDLSS